MKGMEYFYELYSGIPRGGPGDNGSTRKAFSVMKGLPLQPNILDIGCGPGMQTLELARISNGNIIALDNYQPFLDKLMENARREGLEDRIKPINRSMLEMDFRDETFDVVWSEGALYFMGFAKGLERCRQLLKDNGYLAVTEAVLFRPDPPRPVIEFWEKEYPAITDVESNIEMIRRAKFRLISHFPLPVSSWLDNFYDPMEALIHELMGKYEGNKVAMEIFGNSLSEVSTYKKYSDYFGYEFFIMQKTE
ncbi:MAG: class I SAM-dependent methyltransferase [Candidatus Thermoplasmatota archaeon]|jgi:SAM-dependent methyltransferase|nr:class I SAM-dependent methyltransferase [Candidatus Thermoplasmatota archaeon]MDP7265968.1 class I SAM-dependent methyltransferase [Candidatus Thermoplasmatota archaeon]